MSRTARQTSASLVLAVDLAGTLVFAVEGAMRAVNARFDLFGVLVLAFATAVGGGTIRDVVIGDLPPAAYRYRRYAITAIVGGLVVFAFHSPIHDLSDNVILTLDAAGLSLFAVTGAAKSLDFGLNSVSAVILGAVTGVGGGVIRDILLNQVPSILVVDVYAVAALAGAAVTVLAVHRRVPAGVALACGAAVCFALRVGAIAGHWNLPRAT